VLRGCARNGAGACIVPGVAKGDIVVAVYNISTLASAASSFETTVTIPNQIQQSSASNLSAVEVWWVTIPQS
jgi:hypothetical protein